MLSIPKERSDVELTHNYQEMVEEGGTSVQYTLRSKLDCILLAVVLAAGGFYGGFLSSIFNPMADPLLQDYYHLDPDKDKADTDFYKGAFNAFFAVGGMLGVFSTGFLANVFGRRFLLYASEFMALANCVLYTIDSLNVLLVARFISGWVSGMASVGSIIISELLPNEISGYGNASGYIIGVSAMLLAYMTQNVLTRQELVEWHKELLCLPALVSIMRLITLPFFLRSDTPKYAYQLAENEDAAFDLVKNCYRPIYEKECLMQVTYDTIRNFKKQKEAVVLKFKNMFSDKFRMRLFSGCFLAFAQQMCGINFFIFYSTKIFDDLMNIGKTMTLVIGISNVCGGFVALYLIERKGRKFNLFYGCAVQTVAMVMLLIGIKMHIEFLLIAAACIYIIAFAAGLGGSYSAYLCEILPPAGVGISMTVQYIFTALIAQFVPPLNSLLGSNVLLLSFTIICALLTFGLGLWTVETKGKKEQEILETFDRGLKPFDFS